MENFSVQTPGPVKMDEGWLAYFRDELKTFKPVCRYCGEACQKGSYADHLFPYLDKASYHKTCHERSQKEQMA